MARLIWIVFISLILVLTFLGVRYGKDLYMILPIEEVPSFEEANFQDWHEFSGRDGRFHVLVPQLPQHVAKNVHDEKLGQKLLYNVYTSEHSNGSLYTVLLITYPEPLDLAQQDEQLQAVVDRLMKGNKDNRLKLRTISKFHGFDALDLALENNEYQIVSKAFFVEDTLYVLTSMSYSAGYNANEFQFFVNSFQLMEDFSVPNIEPTPFIEK